MWIRAIYSKFYIDMDIVPVTNEEYLEQAKKRKASIQASQKRLFRAAPYKVHVPATLAKARSYADDATVVALEE